ncbi:hypothetical protein ES319_D10G152700v1 [Gossypium barbadense]|uniref:Uncharacterized protein n=2 Tax=Gossypium TaxID=3633 RepID=A0A5J5PSQ1_GOSBA|nr:hypothetical protein ES319_D10G152700v1 [Gossypium barbadense]TYG50286.1 hypothetical protein ES288_D10G162600v1 [Gossypium darwinii]
MHLFSFSSFGFWLNGKCRKKVAESSGFCLVDFLFVSHFPTDKTKDLGCSFKQRSDRYYRICPSLFVCCSNLGSNSSSSMEIQISDFKS